MSRYLTLAFDGDSAIINGHTDASDDQLISMVQESGIALNTKGLEIHKNISAQQYDAENKEWTPIGDGQFHICMRTGVYESDPVCATCKECHIHARSVQDTVKHCKKKQFSALCENISAVMEK